MDQLTLSEKFGSNYVLLELSGAVNSYTIAELKQKLMMYIEDAYVVLDLSNVTVLDSSGMGLFMGAFNSSVRMGTKLFFMNPSDAAKRVIDATGFSDTFHFLHSVTEIE